MLRDQFLFLLRSGFDAFEVKKDADARGFAEVAALHRVLSADRRRPCCRRCASGCSPPVTRAVRDAVRLLWLAFHRATPPGERFRVPSESRMPCRLSLPSSRLGPWVPA